MSFHLLAKSRIKFNKKENKQQLYDYSFSLHRSFIQILYRKNHSSNFCFVLFSYSTKSSFNDSCFFINDIDQLSILTISVSSVSQFTFNRKIIGKTGNENFSSIHCFSFAFNYSWLFFCSFLLHFVHFSFAHFHFRFWGNFLISSMPLIAMVDKQKIKIQERQGYDETKKKILPFTEISFVFVYFLLSWMRNLFLYEFQQIFQMCVLHSLKIWIFSIHFFLIFFYFRGFFLFCFLVFAAKNEKDFPSNPFTDGVLRVFFVVWFIRLHGLN